MYKQDEVGKAENSNLDLHEESLAKRRGVKLAKKEKRTAKATNPQSSWCV